MKIGILSQWFDPEPGPASLPGALARSLVARGHDVQVVTGFPNYPDGRVADGYQMRRRSDEVVEGVKVRRVMLYPSHSASIAGRIANYASFAASAWSSGVSAFRDVDAVWVSNSPVTIGLPMRSVSARLRKPIVLHVLDLWPDNILSSGLISNGWAARGMESAVHRWNTSMYQHAASVAAISPGIVSLLASRGVPSNKLHHIPMWADEDSFYPAADQRLRRRLGVPDNGVVVLYAGALGGTQAIETLIRACGTYPDSAPALECWIAGSGVQEENLRALAASQTAASVPVRFLGRVPSDEMSAVMASADVHFVGLRADPLSSITMPSKIQATMASAKPMVVAIPGDAQDAVVSAGAGFAADPAHPDTIVDALVAAATSGREHLAAMGAAARRAYDAHYSLQSGTDRIEDLLRRASTSVLK